MRTVPLLLLCAACVGPKVVPAPAAPVAIEPRALRSTQGPAPAGAGTLVLDVLGRSAKVFAVQKPHTGEETFVPLCETPCSVNLLVGTHVLSFVAPREPDLTGEATVEVTPGTTLVRHAMGYERALPTGVGISGLVLGGAGLVTAFIGAVVAGSNVGDTSQNRAIGVTLITLGVGGFAGAWTLLARFRAERQDGATTIVKLR